ncbi:Gamma-aminobutyric acid (GABA) B receptor [Seminavis robusta]|uniref:Gamma-aminobutyric acid (GABA) B receptor n=1 Tax=Seminavis robusta TaxID=568900 RepID=A0A9N8DMC5_9STRA|nr:Gamma-aminobutyric acid (GABA) B receptor [Seminavis robusta]|eukprot:Sro222_g091150.1 Gamma-aminobutyric acid (GABA) B receptor (1359) ;mRNA; r:26815-30891
MIQEAEEDTMMPQGRRKRSRSEMTGDSLGGGEGVLFTMYRERWGRDLHQREAYTTYNHQSHSMPRRQATAHNCMIDDECSPRQSPWRTTNSSYSSARHCGKRRNYLLLLPVWIVLWFSLLMGESHASVACNTTEQCVAILQQPGSSTDCVDGYCTNPFQEGCLRHYLGTDRFPSKRTCNSEDMIFSEETQEWVYDDTHCQISPFGYSEIRILSQNWESAMFTSWILQIVLSELAQVPATIESSGPNRQLNFYDPAMSFSYGALGYDFDALQRANTVLLGATCPRQWRQTDNATLYQSCAHVITEVWSGHAPTVAELTAASVLEPPEGTGAVGKLSWFLPKFVAKRDPSLTHWLGIAGDFHRRKVASTFYTPTTFGHYCREIVPHNCTIETLFASRPPLDEAEADKYFVPGGIYQGYFRYTEENDCDLHPTTCHGHIADVPCEWTTFVTPQAYHLDIAVASKGSLEPNHAYSYGQLLDIWAAANATQSALLFYWWYPDPTYQRYLGTDAEMQAVQLPPPQQECVTHRVTPAQRCSANSTERRADAVGACDPEAHSLWKLIIANLYPYLQGRMPQLDNNNQNESSSDDTMTTMTINVGDPNIAKYGRAFQSPAYGVLQALSITELQLGDMLEAWELKGVDQWNYDPREAVCEWMAANVDTFQTWIPRTYPRVLQQERYNQDTPVLHGIAVGLASTVILGVVAVSCAVYYWRNRPVLMFAQVGFLTFVLLGLLLVSLAALFKAVEPRDGVCVAQQWLLLLGFTLELVPLIVKVGAIHRMMQAAKRMKRITLQVRQLYGTVLLCCVAAVLLLSIWTAVDPSQRTKDITLHPDRITEHGETIVTVTHFCASENTVWRYTSMIWQLILLLCATILAIQTRNIRQDLNESHTLGVMIYSQFVFVVLRSITFVLETVSVDGAASISRSTLEALRSLILSLDVFVALNIYFTPKLWMLYHHDDDYFKTMLAVQRRASSVVDSVSRYSMINTGTTGSGLNLNGSVSVCDPVMELDLSVASGSKTTTTARRRRSSKMSSLGLTGSSLSNISKDMDNSFRTANASAIVDIKDIIIPEGQEDMDKTEKVANSSTRNLNYKVNGSSDICAEMIDDEETPRGAHPRSGSGKTDSTKSTASETIDDASDAERKLARKSHKELLEEGLRNFRNSYVSRATLLEQAAAVATDTEPPMAIAASATIIDHEEEPSDSEDDEEGQGRNGVLDVLDEKSGQAGEERGDTKDERESLVRENQHNQAEKRKARSFSGNEKQKASPTETRRNSDGKDLRNTNVRKSWQDYLQGIQKSTRNVVAAIGNDETAEQRTNWTKYVNEQGVGDEGFELDGEETSEIDDIFFEELCDNDEDLTDMHYFS